MPTNKAVAVGLRMPADEVAAIDRHARRLSEFMTGKRRVTRTTVIRMAVADWLARQA